MAYLTYTKDPIGRFVEKDFGKTFEYSDAVSKKFSLT